MIICSIDFVFLKILSDSLNSYKYSHVSFIIVYIPVFVKKCTSISKSFHSIENCVRLKVSRRVIPQN